MNKATYEVPNKTDAAKEFDARPQLGTGGQYLKSLREQAGGHVDVIDAVWHAASHVNGHVIRMERETGRLTEYQTVNPPGDWGRATVHARESMSQSLNPLRARLTRLN